MLTSIALALLFVCAQKNTDVRDDSQNRVSYRRIETIFDNKDWNGLSRVLTADIIEESPVQHKIGKREFMKEHVSQFGLLKEINMRISLGDIKMAKNRATVEERYLLTANLKDSKGTHSMRAEGSEMDLWRKSRGVWAVGYIKEHDSTLTIDGKVVRHSP